MTWSRISTSFRSLEGDDLLLGLLGSLGVVSGSVVVVIVGFLFGEALPALQAPGLTRFLGDPSWNPVEGRFLLLPMVAGTLLASLGAVALAGPAGIASAVFCRFYAPPSVAAWYRRLVQVFAGVPSVVYGFWGLVVLVPWIGALRPPGASLLAASLVLGLMIHPTVALLVDASLRAVPPETLHGAEALGLGRWRVAFQVCLPAARRGIAAALLLATARAVGETMAVLMVAGNVVQVPGSPFDPVRTLTANIALEMAYAMGEHRTALFLTGLVLMGLAALLVAAGGGSSREG